MATDELAARLQAVEDRLAIIELEGAYARAFDDRRGEEWAALFTEDGVYRSRGAGPGGPGVHCAGREALARFCREAPFSGIHFLHLPQVTLDGDRATSRIHLEFYGSFHEDGAPYTRMLGYYDVAYRRAGGSWLIEHRVTTTFGRQGGATFGYPTGSGLTGD